VYLTFVIKFTFFLLIRN